MSDAIIPSVTFFLDSSEKFSVSLPLPSFVYLEIRSTPTNASKRRGINIRFRESPRNNIPAIILKKGYV